VVAEGYYRPNEVSHFSASDDGQDYSHKRVIMGVASWYFPEGSQRTSQLDPPNVGDPGPCDKRGSTSSTPSVRRQRKSEPQLKKPPAMTASLCKIAFKALHGQDDLRQAGGSSILSASGPCDQYVTVLGQKFPPPSYTSAK
jgi:hypothetical protein